MPTQVTKSSRLGPKGLKRQWLANELRLRFRLKRDQIGPQFGRSNIDRDRFGAATVDSDRSNSCRHRKFAFFDQLPILPAKRARQRKPLPHISEPEPSLLVYIQPISPGDCNSASCDARAPSLICARTCPSRAKISPSAPMPKCRSHRARPVPRPPRSIELAESFRERFEQVGARQPRQSRCPALASS